jgi:hypothetical protein
LTRDVRAALAELPSGVAPTGLVDPPSSSDD